MSFAGDIANDAVNIAIIVIAIMPDDFNISLPFLLNRRFLYNNFCYFSSINFDFRGLLFIYVKHKEIVVMICSDNKNRHIILEYLPELHQAERSSMIAILNA